MKNKNILTKTGVLFLIAMLVSLTATGSEDPRLPVIGQDDGNWGEYLNNYLLVSLATNGALNNNIVGADQLKNSSVTEEKLAQNSVGTLQLIDNAITGAKIALATITAVNIAENAILSSHIRDGEITNNDISDVAGIEMSKLTGILPHTMGGTGQSIYQPGDILYAASNGDLEKLPLPNEYNALLGGDAAIPNPYWGQITTKQIQDESIQSEDVLDGTLTGDDFNSNSNLKVSNLDVGTINSAPYPPSQASTLEIISVEKSCPTTGCTIEISCPQGYATLMVWTTEYGTLCQEDGLVWSCRNKCVDSCQVTSLNGGASGVARCARIV